MAKSSLKMELHPDRVVLDFGGDSAWVKEVVALVNADLNLTGLYDEFHLVPSGSGGNRTSVYVCVLGKDQCNVPPRVQLHERMTEATIATVADSAGVVRGPAIHRGEAMWREKKKVEQPPHMGQNEKEMETEEKEKKEKVEGEEEEEQEEVAFDPPFLHSRLNLPSVYIQSLCRHARMRLVAIDKTTKYSIGASTYLFDNK